MCFFKDHDNNMAANSIEIIEILPKHGHLFREQSPTPVLCKLKIMPLKSVTLEKLEKMQKDAQETIKRQEEKQKLEVENNTEYKGESINDEQ